MKPTWNISSRVKPKCMNCGNSGLMVTCFWVLHWVVVHWKPLICSGTHESYCGGAPHKVCRWFVSNQNRWAKAAFTCRVCCLTRPKVDLVSFIFGNAHGARCRCRCRAETPCCLRETCYSVFWRGARVREQGLNQTFWHQVGHGCILNRYHNCCLLLLFVLNCLIYPHFLAIYILC